ncbi:MAG: response regulator transcription factor [Sphingobacteriales bacterium]|nr:MAG: response regulator transcription factor [Sphingobacteriales bacterium]
MHEAEIIEKDKSNRMLSKREMEILQSIKKGYLYKEVGTELHISSETVKKHLRNIYNKLSVRNKTEAINKLFG